MNAWWAWGLLAAIGVLGGIGDVWVYRWAKSDRTPWLAASCLAHAASVVLFGLLLKWDGRAFGTAFMLSSVVHVVLVVAADVLYLGGRPTSAEWAGMALAAVALVLLEAGRAEEPRGPVPPPVAGSALDPEGAHP